MGEQTETFNFHGRRRPARDLSRVTKLTWDASLIERKRACVVIQVNALSNFQLDDIDQLLQVRLQVCCKAARSYVGVPEYRLSIESAFVVRERILFDVHHGRRRAGETHQWTAESSRTAHVVSPLSQSFFVFTSSCSCLLGLTVKARSPELPAASP